jgi:hypothetical protein
VSLLAFVPSALDFIGKFSKGQGFVEPRPWWLLALAIAIVLLVRFPRFAIFVTKLLLPRIESEPLETSIFRGPASYAEADAESFYGRAKDAADCWAKLRDSTFFVIDGDSGAGKSSFLNAAIIPRARSVFTVVACRSANDPFAQFRTALLKLGASQPPTSDANSEEEILDYVAGTLPTTKDKPLLVFLDQFDEFFVTVEQATRRRFLLSLRALISRGKARVAICVRSDFLDLLLAECRSVDSAQEALSLDRYFTLQAFSPDEAEEVVRRMVMPLHREDPVRKQELSDFATELVHQLVRPTTDKRRPRDSVGIVLAAELQIVGFMAESIVGGKGLSREAIIRLGGRLGLYKEYIETAKDYVWRATGVTGNDALLILRQLISPASTKYSQTITDIADHLQKSPAVVESVLMRFGDRYLVRRTADSADVPSSKRFELMHEHLTEVLKEAPDPYLQKLRDAEERLAFWAGRATHANENKPARRSPRFLFDVFRQPVPTLEAISLWRFALRRSDRILLRRSIGAFTVRSALYLAVLLVPLGVFYLWWRNDAHQIALLVAEAPYKEVIEERAGWTQALALIGECDAVERVAHVTRGDDTRLKMLAVASQTAFRSGYAGCGLELLNGIAKVPTSPWSNEFRFFAVWCG